jgi:hypothetical protein
VRLNGESAGIASRKKSCKTRKIAHSLTNALFARPSVWLARFAVGRLVLTSSTALDLFSNHPPKDRRSGGSNCNARPDETMSSSDTPAVKRSGRVKNKRFVQPVVPALPQLADTRKNHDTGTYQADCTTNGVIQETLEKDSGRASPAASSDLPNGVHKDDIQEASQSETNIENDRLSVTPSPALQNGTFAPGPCTFAERFYRSRGYLTSA